MRCERLRHELAESQSRCANLLKVQEQYAKLVSNGAARPPVSLGSDGPETSSMDARGEATALKVECERLEAELKKTQIEIRRLQAKPVAKDTVITTSITPSTQPLMITPNEAEEHVPESGDRDKDGGGEAMLRRRIKQLRLRVSGIKLAVHLVVVVRGEDHIRRGKLPKDRSIVVGNVKRT